MSKLSEIKADLALKALLSGNVIIDETALDVYAQYEQPASGLADEFIRIYYNGNAKALVKPIGLFSGNLAVAVYCMAKKSNGTVKRNRMDAIVAQIQNLVDEKVNDGYYFELSATPITPITVNDTTGYGLTTLNVEWREI
jgi:hypothetical protein